MQAAIVARQQNPRRRRQRRWPGAQIDGEVGKRPVGDAGSDGVSQHAGRADLHDAAIGAVAAEARDGVEDGRVGELGAVVFGHVERPVPVGLGALVAALVDEGVFILPEEIAVFVLRVSGG